jgi:hypothetical protein
MSKLLTQAAPVAFNPVSSVVPKVAGEAVDPSKVAQLLADPGQTGAALRQLPVVGDRLRAAATAAETAQQTMARSAEAQKALTRMQEQLSKNSVYAKIAQNAQTPEALLDTILSSKQAGRAPLTAINDLYKASGFNKEAMASLIQKWAVQKGDPAAQAEALLSRLGSTDGKGGSGKMLLQWMVEKGLIDQSSRAQLQAQMTHLVSVKQAQKAATNINVDLEPHMGDLSQLLSRYVGAQSGGTLGSGSGAPLVMAGAGSKFVQKAMNRYTGGSQKPIIEKAMSDPAEMQRLLQAYLDMAGKNRGYRMPTVGGAVANSLNMPYNIPGIIGGVLAPVPSAE